MSEERISIPLPLDDERFLRRECPFCRREFKIQISKEDLTNLAQNKLDSFLLEEKKDETLKINDFNNKSSNESLHTCPYCGQKAPLSDWWTKEQIKYIEIFAENVMIDIINKNLIRPLKKKGFSSSKSDFISLSLEFKGTEMKKKEPWISPEENDMKIFDLPCCKCKIKIEEEWNKDVCCFFCGFQYKWRNVD